MIATTESLVDDYVRYGHYKVEGWLTDGCISIITKIAQAQKLFDIKGHVCEIGVYQGKLFILLYLLTRPNENAVAIDIFERQDLNIDLKRLNIDINTVTLARNILIKNIEAFAKDTHKLRVIAEDSTKINSDDIKNSVGGEVRLFSVDGGHSAFIARNDLKIACKSICEGGVILLDDYFNPAWPGVSEGTNQFFFYDNEFGIVPFAIGENKVFLTSSSYADKYIEYLWEWNINNRLGCKQEELFGHRVIYFDFGSEIKLNFQTFKSIVVIKRIWKTIKEQPLGLLIKWFLHKSGIMK